MANLGFGLTLTPIFKIVYILLHLSYGVKKFIASSLPLPPKIHQVTNSMWDAGEGRYRKV
jgi:hypothetical protein